LSFYRSCPGELPSAFSDGIAIIVIIIIVGLTASHRLAPLT